MRHEGTVFVVDDDADVRKSLTQLLEGVGWSVRAYATATEFLEGYDPSRLGCLLLDVRLPGMSGIQLQETLQQRGIAIPVIIVTGHGDVPTAVAAMKRHALDFVEKPFRAQPLLDRVYQALAQDMERRRATAESDTIKARFALLTPREREVVDLAISGMTNKQIAARFAVSAQAIDARRAKAMDKLRADNIADLVRLALKAGRGERREAEQM